MILEFDWNRGLFLLSFLDARKSGLEEAVNRPKLAFAVSLKHLSNETKIYIFITRIPRVVYIIIWDFSKILCFPPLVDIYRHPLLSKILREKLHFGKREGRILANVFPSPLSHSYITRRSPILNTRQLCKTRASHICGGLECRLGQKPFV